MKNKTIWVLVGPPSVGKSTWINKTFGKYSRPYIINRDDIVEKVAEEYGLSYDDMFTNPPSDQIIEANNKVQKLFNERVREARGQEKIVVDMTNLTVNSRKSALKSVSGLESEYYKIAVVFKFLGFEDLIRSVAKQRSGDYKKLGKSKTISDKVFDSMFGRYQEVQDEEGFDEIIEVDNLQDLQKIVQESNTLKYLTNYASHKI